MSESREYAEIIPADGDAFTLQILHHIIIVKIYMNLSMNFAVVRKLQGVSSKVLLVVGLLDASCFCYRIFKNETVFRFLFFFLFVLNDTSVITVIFSSGNRCQAFLVLTKRQCTEKLP